VCVGWRACGVGPAAQLGRGGEGGLAAPSTKAGQGGRRHVVDVRERGAIFSEQRDSRKAAEAGAARHDWAPGFWSPKERKRI
jgi:hypothetical protein